MLGESLIEFGKLFQRLGPRKDSAFCPLTVRLKGFNNLKAEFLVHLSEELTGVKILDIYSGPSLL